MTSRYPTKAAAQSDGHLIDPGRCQRQIERGRDVQVQGLHGGAEVPGDSEAREVIEHGREIAPFLFCDPLRLPRHRSLQVGLHA